MSLLRALRAYVGLGPDEDYEDRYLQALDRDIDERRGTGRAGVDLDEAAERAAGSYQSSRRRDGSARLLLDDPDDESGSGPEARSIATAPDLQSVPQLDDEAERTPERGAAAGLMNEEDVSVADGSDIDLREAARGRYEPETELDDVLADGVRAKPRTTNHAGSPAGNQSRRQAGNHPAGSRPVDARGDEAVVHSLDSMRAKPRTIAPESFADAKLVADEFRRDIPVLLNLQALDRELARRLVDFASGICYALDGSMEKVASQAFLLIPESVEVSDEDRRRIEERGYAR